MRMLHGSALPTLCVAAAIAACGGDSGPSGNAVATLAVTPDRSTLYTVAPGKTVTLVVDARDQDRVVVAVTPSFTSSNTAVATVSAAGVVTGLTVGDATITTSIANSTKTATSTITVVAAGPDAAVNAPDLTFNPFVANVAVGGTVTWTAGDLHPHTVHFDVAGAPADIGQFQSTTVSRTFPTSGTFPYHCEIHAGMNGSVVVH